jgi:hypothetical protein
LKLKQKAEPHTASCPKEIPNFSPAQILQGQSERWQMLCHRRTSAASASTSVVERSVEGATAVCQKKKGFWQFLGDFMCWIVPWLSDRKYANLPFKLMILCVLFVSETIRCFTNFYIETL